jgi:putative membrane-bound dehydrogenase-like protein
MLLLLAGNALLPAEDGLGVRVPEGFEVTLFADDDQAHDIYSLAVDSFGRVAVSGAGYVKLLADTNGDGKADTVTTFVDGPRTGAQGMYFVGRDLLCAGDDGLIRYRDRNGDDRADGPPDVFLRIKAGGEHDLHAIRKGPDGWWYVIAGNTAGVDESYVTLETSPVPRPQAGTVMRFKPDLSAGEVYADGFRNAYDFDFNEIGDLFSFDSDGERDITLPWYLPIRVLHVLPGSSQGWFSRSWKQPDHFFDMPPMIREFGRGSPTGVVVYRHSQFPEEYQGALFALDWTYGRIFALPLEPDGSSYQSEPIEFMTAVGQHGFAPTDCDVGPDGSLYVSVGGRGTRGSVYRIRAKDRPLPSFGAVTPSSPEEKLETCLTAPQPLSSWSRRIWEPLAAELKKPPFLQAAVDRDRSASERIRAIEILTEKFEGLDEDRLATLASDPEPTVRARAAWSIGRGDPRHPATSSIRPFLEDGHPLVVRSALEALLGADPETFGPLIEPLGKQLGSADRFVRQTAMRLLARLDDEMMREMAAIGFRTGWRAAVPVAAAFALKRDGYAEYPIDIALRILQGDHPEELKLEAVRVLQLGLGDVGPGFGDRDPVFDGYASRIDLSDHEQELDGLRVAVADLYPTGLPMVDQELERVIAMIRPANDRLLEAVLERITSESHPVEDIHRLIVLARMPVQRTAAQRERIAEALLHLEVKIAERKLPQDSNWDDRILEMYHALVEQDPGLPVALLEHEDFGLPGHVQFLSECPPERFEDAITAFVRAIELADPDEYAWNADVIFLLGQSENENERDLIREKFHDFALRNAVLYSLSVEPQERDRALFVEGLDTAPVEVMKDCLTALALLSPSDDPRENVILARTLRKLGDRGEEREARDQAVELLRRNLGENHGYELGRNGAPQQDAIDAWVASVQQRFPEDFARQAGEDTESLSELMDRLAAIDWSQGDAGRGEELFQQRGCVQCHGARRALGPDLSGVAGRFSREDLFIAIVFPDRDVSPRYRTTQIATTDGHVRTGLIVYESVDGLVLRDSNNQTYRIETSDIEVRRVLNKSLMPAGLLKGLSDADLADLNAYLRNLGTKTASSR